ncbi:MAG: serine/threonine protein kinase [Gammaproteobacteria bacterium]|nr:serine/threonine protein kinase [Gammaproteobacteria bacterium]MCP5424231.1 serine/threonine protein kinase [Gammaproteobacteria bacterium]MCP5458895.1 serine/threonine protein kinase [Gammaproteobacteria bacterium]
MDIPGYHIDREIGSGGMATVFLAVQESLGRLVALKLIKPELATNSNFAQRFLREGRIGVQLNHPNIVNIFDIGSHKDFFYLVMEYVPGGTLRDYISQGISIEESIRVIKIIADALGYAHSRGIIHRDIKPQNILFHGNGNPMIVDFGIAKSVNSKTGLTNSGMSLGTPRYMSPEQIRGKVVGTQSDLYSLGVMFYEMLTGQLPYSANDSFALAFQHVSEPIPRLPCAINFLQPIINKLLAKNPEQRYPTAEAFIEELTELEYQYGIGEKVITPKRYKINKFKYKYIRMASVAALGFLGMIVVNANQITSPFAISSSAETVSASVARADWNSSKGQSAVHDRNMTSTLKATGVEATGSSSKADLLLAKAINERNRGANAESVIAIVNRGLMYEPDNIRLLRIKEALLWDSRIDADGKQKDLDVEKAGQDIESVEAQEPSNPLEPLVEPDTDNNQPTDPNIGVFELGKAIDDAIGDKTSPPSPTSNHSTSSTSSRSLTVTTNPQDAQVRIMNIPDLYHDGIVLPPGRYQIRVDRSGYNTHTRWLEVTTKNLVIKVDLKRVRKHYSRRADNNYTPYHHIRRTNIYRYTAQNGGNNLYPGGIDRFNR